LPNSVMVRIPSTLAATQTIPAAIAAMVIIPSTPLGKTSALGRDRAVASSDLQYQGQPMDIWPFGHGNPKGKPYRVVVAGAIFTYDNSRLLGSLLSQDKPSCLEGQPTPLTGHMGRLVWGRGVWMQW
jgi:hypothetical protein